jgi:hypothetical protein
LKQIETLVDDIYAILDGRNPLEGLPENLAKQFGERMERLVMTRLVAPEERIPRLSPSNIGKPCERQVWYSINKADLAEPLAARARVSFLYGDIVEELLLFLAEAAGHKVEGRQDRVEIEGIYGSRDAVIDGVLIDVKSASSQGFKKFKDGTLAEDDQFGYIGQIQTYLEASQDDPLLVDKTRCAFLVMDKGLGHICLDIHHKVNFDVREITRRKIATMASPEVPDRGFGDVEDGYTKDGVFRPNGNMKLGVACGYCPFKHTCWPNLRTFLSKKNPVYMTKVVKEPKMVEVMNGTPITMFE